MMDQEMYDKMWTAIAQVRDASPRVPNDADSGDILTALEPIVEEYARKFAAEKIRTLTIYRSFRDHQDKIRSYADDVEDGRQ
jgi:hypothetical protein